MADILSQEEIDALLEIIDEDSITPDASDNKLISDYQQVTLYDFKRPNIITKKEMKDFRNIHDNFVIKMQEKFHDLIPFTTAELQPHSVDQMTYSEFLMSLPSPTSFNIIKLNNNENDIVIEINPSILSKIIDLLLGSDPSHDSSPTMRNFNEIETEIIKDIIKFIINNLFDVSPSYKIINQCSASYQCLKQPLESNDVVVMIAIEIIIGHTSGMLNIMYPAEFIKENYKGLWNV